MTLTCDVVNLEPEGDYTQNPDVPGDRHGHAAFSTLANAESYRADDPTDKRTA
ncbi:MAG: hypothetical protein ACI9BW_003018 [Gammaproteobacteria bacterium]|jgi:hypothetical protein